jgi:hypothetical protein
MGTLIDLSGQRFGRLTAIRYIKAEKKWECLCDCGTTKIVKTMLLRSGKTRSCGCLRREVVFEKIARAKLKDRTGERYGRLIAVSYDGYRNSQAFWKCKCDCGNIVVVNTDSLRRGTTNSCGCLRKEITSTRMLVHGHAKRQKGKSSEYMTWQAMKKRCLNSNDKSYTDYGGRGIKVCDRWMAFENFIRDMGPRPRGHSLERMDVNGDYCPENCKWIPISEQSKNQRTTRWLTYGNQSMVLKEWAKLIGISAARLAGLLKQLTFSDIIDKYAELGKVFVKRTQKGEFKVVLRNIRENAQTEKKVSRTKRRPEYTAWAHMKTRCLNQNSPDYAYYGGRGIRVCDRWKDSFNAFFQDMGPKPRGTSLDRIDPNGDYETGNCRWATKIQQQQNRRMSLWLTYGNKAMVATEWAKLIGITLSALLNMIGSRGWEEAVAYYIGKGKLNTDDLEDTGHSG